MKKQLVPATILLCVLLGYPLMAESAAFEELRRMLSASDLAGAQAEIERLSPTFGRDPEFRQLQVQTLRAAARIALQKERSEDAVLLYRQADQIEASPIREAIQRRDWAAAMQSIDQLKVREGLTPRTRLLLAEYWIAQGEAASARGAQSTALSSYRAAAQFWPDNSQIESRIRSLESQQAARAAQAGPPANPPPVSSPQGASAFPYAAGGALPQMGTKSYFMLDAEATARLIESLTSPDAEGRNGLSNWARDFRPREIVLLVLLALANIQLGLLLVRRLRR